MTITLSPDQLSWIETRIEAGEFADIAGAVRSLLAEAIAQREDDDIDDLAWAKPLVDDALADIERGHFTVVDDTDVYIDALFKSTEA